MGKRVIRHLTPKGIKLKEDYAWQAKSQYQGKPLEGPLEVSLKLYFKDKRVRDWDNWHKASMDSLSGIIWVDDTQIKKATVEMGYDKAARIEVIVKEI